MPIALTHHEALLFHHFTTHLGRWLDCTNAARMYTLGVSEKAREYPILFNAVLCFAARHRRENEAAEAAYERCVTLLIDRLNGSPTSYDDMLLSAVLLLHFADQLMGEAQPGSVLRDKHHLKGTSSILRATRSTSFIDPSATSIRDASFWIYVRQCLYNATISQQPLDIDFSLQLQPAPESIKDSHPLAWLRTQTAWANQILWHTACVANFCFKSTTATQIEPVPRATQWQELWERIQSWQKHRPSDFNPIGSGPTGDGHVFPDIWFTADWHVISYVFYHFSCILLLRYNPDSKFPIRWVRDKLSISDRKILHHARAICSACKSSIQNAQLFIILCHTVFIWGPLVFDPKERGEVIRLLRIFEQTHSWRTEWIVEALRMEWNMA